MRMVDEAVRLMPASLRMALESHRREVPRGMLSPMVAEDAAEHRPPWSGGSLDQTVERDARGLLDTLAHPTRFGRIAEQFGTLAHYVADAGFPPGATRTDAWNGSAPGFLRFSPLTSSAKTGVLPSSV